MKKLISLLLAVSAVMVVGGCGPSAEPETDSSKISSSEAAVSVEFSTSEVPDSEDTVSAGLSSAEAESTVPSGVRTFEHISMYIPDGFIEGEMMGVTIFYGPDYPTHTDNITITETVAGDIDNYTEDALNAVYEATIVGFQGINSLERTKIDGVDTIELSYGVNTAGVQMTGTQIMLFGDDFTSVVTFTSISGEYDTEFQRCIDSISVN